MIPHIQWNTIPLLLSLISVHIHVNSLAQAHAKRLNMNGLVISSGELIAIPYFPYSPLMALPQKRLVTVREQFYRALKYDQTQAVSRFLAFDPDIERADQQGQTFLIYAARNGYSQLFDILCAQGAQIDVKDSEGKTALMHAAAHGHSTIVQRLLQLQANLDLRCNRGKTALLYATDNNHHAIVPQLLCAMAQGTAQLHKHCACPTVIEMTPLQGP